MTNNFLDLCSPCLSVVGESAHLPFRDRPELISEHDTLRGLEGLDELEDF
jgi:hypothetical protein